ncbi:hypothetical protein [Fischerella sp. PCC 9605]|uniref:hypothetical protein n=1 Tax=Fischerella sp. PCC 9605 TaxID=1173024 RepID=UPI0004B3AA18|nr:hypothetical protein [Fischerella sp. PCC 9605]
MRMDFSEFTTSSFKKFCQELPQPGEIWEVSRVARSPLQFSTQEQQNLYSKSARRFLGEDSTPRYVMIVKEPEPAVEQQNKWQVISVMLLSVETSFLSDVDLLIPSHLSGVGQDLLAETWHVLPMLACNLSRLIGQRLSRKVYDLLLTVGDHYHGLVDEAPLLAQIQLLGLEMGITSAKQQPEIQAFHQQEEAWSDVLIVPVAAYRTYIKTMKLTNAILDEALQLAVLQKLVEDKKTARLDFRLKQDKKTQEC